MNESQFLGASLSAAVRGQLAEQRLFDTNLPQLQPGVDAWDRYRMPQVERGGAANTGDESVVSAALPNAGAAEASVQRVRYEQPAMQGSAAHQFDAQQLNSRTPGVDTNSSSGNEKKNDGAPPLLVVGLEIAAAAFFVRCGLKHLAKNGITFFDGAGNAAKSLAPKLDTATKSVSPTSIAELNPIRTTAVNLEQQIPRIRTFERETGPLRVG